MMIQIPITQPTSAYAALIPATATIAKIVHLWANNAEEAPGNFWIKIGAAEVMFVVGPGETRYLGAFSVPAGVDLQFKHDDVQEVQHHIYGYGQYSL